MILRHEADGAGASIVSLPRDLWVAIPGRSSPNRINSAYSDGTDVLTATITQELGIPIHHEVDIDFNGFKDLVDAAGGTTVCFLYPTRDKNTGLDQQPGCHVLDGVQSLQYARSRYYEEFRDGQWRTDPRSDLGRIERQQAFLQQTAESTIDKLQSDPFLASELISAATATVRMDPGLDPIGAAGTLRKAFGTGLNKYQLPVVGVTENGNVFFVERNTARFGVACGRVVTRSAQRSKRSAVPWLADVPALSPADTTQQKGEKADTVNGSAMTVGGTGDDAIITTRGRFCTRRD